MPPHTNVDTPVMRQYLEIKERYPDCIVFFRLGDFYEMFFQDAVVASRLLDLALTSRDKGKEDGVPMCGVPHHAAKFYIGKLISLGRKVAVCDQVEDARLAKKIVRRAVTQVVTPGIILEEEQLEPKASHYLAAVAPGLGPATGHAGLAYLDVSTGEFAATQLPAREAVEELCRLGPAEVLMVGREGEAGPGVKDAAGPGDDLRAALGRRLRVPLGHSRPAGEADDRKLLGDLLGPALHDVDRRDGRGPMLPEWPLALEAAAACARYAQSTQPGAVLPLTRLRLYRHDDDMVIDEATNANLELCQTLMERKREGSLLHLIDQTRTAMGGRLTRRWLLAPLRDVAAIRRRHDAVEWLVSHHQVRDQVRVHLGEIHDLERLTGRISLAVGSPRDLAALRQSLLMLPLIREQLAHGEAGERALGAAPEHLDLGADLCADVAALVGTALVDDPPPSWREGGFIRRGHNAELDELCDISQGGKDHILRIEARERERSGISSLKVGYNRVFGYFIEVTRSNLGKVPPDFIRKQTLANGERYVTAELQEYEAKVLGAEERRVQLELELFERLRQQVAAASQRVLLLAERVARVDALCGLAETAHRLGYVRPEVDDGLRLCIEDGRHPVVEQLAAAGQFVPNDITLSSAGVEGPDAPDEARLAIITGPNMAGKSTVMRQVAVIAILSQMGSFVPARRARLGVVDRVFTRVGASDNLSRGESTFMVEMRETAHILQHASRRSLVVLDEIGRGTSTYDGVSIAWAVAEYLYDVVGCKTLFATHYHELCALAESRALTRNLSVAVREWQGEIVFLHKLVDGGANRSYGIEVARLAGLPFSVVDRAREILRALEEGEQNAEGPVHGLPRVRNQQLALFGGGEPTAAAEVTESGRRRARRSFRGGSAEAPPPSPGEAPQPLDQSGWGPWRASPAAADRPAHDGRAREDAVLQRLRQLDCDGITPRDALALVAELCGQLRSS